MAQNTISQRIALEGAEDVLKQLADLGQAGEKAIQQITDASKGMGAGLGGLSGLSALAQSEFGKVSAALGPIKQDFAALAEAAKGVGERIVEVASVLGVGLVGGLAGGIAGIVELIKSSAEAGHQLEIQAGTVGLTVEQLQAYKRVALEAGVDGDRVFTALVRLTQNLGKETEKLSQDTIKAFAELPAAMQAIGTSIARGSGLPQVGTGKGIFDAGAIGASADAVKRYVDQFVIAQAEEGKALDPNVVEAFRQNVIKLSGDITQVGEKFRLEAAKNSVVFPALTVGEQLKRDAEIAANPVLRLGVTLSDLQKSGENLDPVIRKIIDGIAGISDAAVKNETARSLLGRGAKELTEAFKGGSASLDEALAKLKAGTGLTEEQAKLLGDTEKELVRLGAAGTGLRNQLAVIFAPALIDATKAFTDLIKSNAGTFMGWAATIASEVLPGLANLIRQFGGISEAAHGAADAVSGAKAQPSGAVGATEPPGAITPDLTSFERLRNTAISVANGISTAFGTIKGVLTSIASLINSVFGTNFNAVGVAAALVVGTLTGAFTLLLPVIALVAAAIGLLATPIGLAVAAIGLIVFAITHWQESWDALKAAGSAIVEGIKADFESLVGFIGGVATRIIGSLQSVLDFIGRIGRGLASIAGGGAAPAPGQPGAPTAEGDVGGLGEDSGSFAPGLASGGRVGAHPGRSVGTDTVPAWLTPGEFVNQTAAVQHYGIDLFRALNAMAIPLDYFRGFSLGGIVEAFAPSPSPLMLAAGGAIGPGTSAGGPMHSLTLNMHGQSFQLDVAPGHVFDKLARHARTSAIRSAGTKPSWFQS